MTSAKLTPSFEVPKLKMSVNVTAIQEREISLPYFCRAGDAFIKVISSTVSIEATIYEHRHGVQVFQTPFLEGTIIDAAPCTEGEFEYAVVRAIEMTQAAMFKANEPSNVAA